MIHPHPAPFRRSNLRHPRRQRTLAAVLAFAAAIACSGESPVSPSPQAAALLHDIEAPTTASFLSYLTPYGQAQVEVLNMETQARSMEFEVGFPSSTLTTPSTFSTSPTLASGVKRGGSKSTTVAAGDVGVNAIPPGGCSVDYVDCVYQCLYLQMDFRWYLAEFWRADNDFWNNIKDGKHYLNNLAGGPQDRMRDNFYQIRQNYLKFRGLNCRNYLR